MTLCDGGKRCAAVYIIIAADNKLVPSGAGICAERTALLTGALINRQPGSAIWSHVKVAVQSCGRGGNAIIGQHARPVADTEVIAALAGGLAEASLRAVKYHLALVYRVRGQARNQWIGSGPDGFVILTSVGRRDAGLYP